MHGLEGKHMVVFLVREKILLNLFGGVKLWVLDLSLLSLACTRLALHRLPFETVSVLGNIPEQVCLVCEYSGSRDVM